MGTKIEQLAAEVSAAFESAKRGDGSTYRRIREGSPEWIRDLVREAGHAGGEVLPRDWRFAAVESICDALAGDEDADPPEPDVYTGELLAWLEDPHAIAACDSAAEEGLVSESAGMVDRIQAGQAYMLREIHDAVRAALAERDEDDEDDD
jgi:hypothetical protein